MTPDPPQSFSSMLGEVVDLTAGFSVMVLPFALTLIPGLVLLVLLPLAAIAALAALPLLLALPPYLLVRRLRARRSSR
jgi:hypothetical protein